MFTKAINWIKAIPARVAGFGPHIFAFLAKHKTKLMWMGIGFALAFFLFAFSGCASAAPDCGT